MKNEISLTAKHSQRLSFPHYVRIDNETVSVIHKDGEPIDTSQDYTALTHTGLYRFRINEHLSTHPARGDWNSYGFTPVCSEYSINRH